MKLLILSVLTSVCMLTSAITATPQPRSGEALSGKQQADEPNKDVTIPFQSVNKNIFIQVSVAHSKPLWFVLDTGDKYAVIDLFIAKLLELELGDQVPVGGGGKRP